MSIVQVTGVDGPEIGPLTPYRETLFKNMNTSIVKGKQGHVYLIAVPKNANQSAIPMVYRVFRTLA